MNYFNLSFLKLFWFWDIQWSYYYFNLTSSIIFCYSPEDIYLSLGISLSFSFVTISELLYCEVFENFVISLAIFLPMKSPVAFAILWMALFEEVLSTSVVDFLAWSRIFSLYLPLKCLLIFLPIFLPIFLTKDKIHSLL